MKPLIRQLYSNSSAALLAMYDHLAKTAKCEVGEHMVCAVLVIFVSGGCCLSHLGPRDGREGAVAKALVEVLERSTQVDRLAEGLGAIFVEGCSEKALDMMRDSLPSGLPRIDRDFINLDRANYVDRVTGRDAMLLQVRVLSAGEGTCVVSVEKSLGNLGGSQYTISLVRVQLGWKVVEFEMEWVS